MGHIELNIEAIAYDSNGEVTAALELHLNVIILFLVAKWHFGFPCWSLSRVR